MTALDVISRVDERMHNVFTREEKLLWLNQLEKMVSQLLARCGLEEQWEPVTEETALSIPEPFASMYDRWLEAQMNYANQEYLKFNNAMALFQSLWQEYANALRRENPGMGRRNFF